MFDHRAPNHFEQIMKATGGHGVDVIVEMLANVNLGKDLTILAKGGRVVIIGSRGPVEIDPRNTMQRDADVRGMTLPNTPPAEMASIHAALVGRSGKRDVAAGDRQRISAGRCSAGASSGDGAWRPGKNRAGAMGSRQKIIRKGKSGKFEILLIETRSPLGLLTPTLVTLIFYVARPARSILNPYFFIKCFVARL